MKTLLYLLVTALSAFAILLVIFHFGDIPNRHNNGFKRNYFPTPYSSMRKIDLSDTLHEVIGSTQHNIYVSLSKEGDVLEIGKDGDNKIKRIRIPFFDRFYDSLQFSSLSIKIDSPNIYLFAENKPAIVKTTFDSTLFAVKMLPPGAYSREVMAGPDCFILRKFETRLTDQIFVRYNFSTGSLKKEDTISQIYGDGGIITDGQLRVDAKSKKLCYIYYYKNLLLSFDTSLGFVNRFYSIDTARSFKIKIGLVGNSGTRAYTNISPANIINKASYVENGILYNMSGLKADNESDRFFSDHSILDVIDLNSGRYLGSMNLPVLNGSKLSQFAIDDNKLIALYTKNIVIYDLAIFPAGQ